MGDLHVGTWDSVGSAHLKGVDSNTEDDGKDSGKDTEVKIFLVQERDSTLYDVRRVKLEDRDGGQLIKKSSKDAHNIENTPIEV